MALAFQQRIYWRINDVGNVKWNSGVNAVGRLWPFQQRRGDEEMLLEGYGHSNSGGGNISCTKEPRKCRLGWALHLYSSLPFIALWVFIF